MAAAPLPVAFHLGYHKTATTWFQRVAFPAHPAVRLVSVENGDDLDPFLAEIVSAHLGRVRIEDRPGGGTRAVVQLSAASR